MRFLKCILTDKAERLAKVHKTKAQKQIKSQNPGVSLRGSVLVAHLRGTVCDPMTVVRQAPLSMEFSRQEYWSRLPWPPPRALSHPPLLHWQADSLPSEPPGKLGV